MDLCLFSSDFNLTYWSRSGNIAFRNLLLFRRQNRAKFELNIGGKLAVELNRSDFSGGYVKLILVSRFTKGE